MASDEPIRTDASTVHRPAATPSDPSPQTDSPSSDSNRPPNPSGDRSGAWDAESITAADLSEADQIAEARTVIRGSSRSEGPRGGGGDPVDRSPAAVAKVLLGQRLNHFRLDALIGGGGMGAVFRALDEKLDRTVAIKVIPFVGDDPDLQRRFRNEAQSAAKLDHPRIAKVFDAGSHGQWHYIVFEYVEGTNIRDSVHSDGPLTIDEAVFFTSQLAGALQHAADRGIVHRDIKPSNVLIGPEGKIKLVDMGLARSDNLELSEDMTASGVTLGTFDYISPEQARDPRDADLRSDIYSLGCTLYFMLTGSPPYPGGTMLQKLLSHGNAPPPDVRQLRPEVSGNLVAVMQKMLAKHPVDRYQTATDLIADLREVAFRDSLVRSQAVGPVAISQPNPLVAWFERNAPWMVAMALLVISAGWLQLESAASREELTIPNSAAPPQSAVPLPSPATPTSVPAANGAAGPDRQRPSGGDAIPPPSTAIVTAPSMIPPAPPGTPLTGTPLTGTPLTGSTLDSPLRPVGVMPDPADAAGAGSNLAEANMTAASSDSEVSSRRESDPAAVSPDQDPLPIESADAGQLQVIRVLGKDFRESQDRDDSGALLSPTLSDALRLAARLGTGRIEIAVPVLYSEPVSVEIDNLVITSSLVGGSAIVFQPNDSVAMERSKMFRVGSHPIEFHNLHFVWNVPSGEIDGGALFEINDNHLIMTDCSVTVNNPTLREEVYAWEVVTDPDKVDRPDDDAAAIDPFPLVWIDLSNVVVRGQMTMLHMDYAAKLSLFWENGLLSISETMIDTAGALRDPPSNAGPIQVSLTRVTAHTPGGLMRMRVGVSGGYPVAVDRFARKSVFVVDPDVPHFEFTGLSDLQRSAPLLRFRGGSNAYVVEPSLVDPLLRLADTDGQQQITRMNDLLSGTPDWADEISPRWSVNWAALQLSEAPPSSRRITDYRQNDPYDPSPPGFEEKTMPQIPQLSSAEPSEVSDDRSAELGPAIREEL